MLIGKKVTLRAIEESDLLTLKDWRNTEEFRKFFREYRELNDIDQKKWFDSQVVKNDKTIMFAIIENKTHKLIGACGLCYINWVCRNAELSIYIGKNNVYIDNIKNGYAWEALNLLFEYAFNRLNLHKVWTEIYDFDSVKNEFFKKYGFKKEAILRDNYFYDGKYCDSLIFSILNNEFRKN